MATELIASSSSAETGMSVTCRRVVTPNMLTSPPSGMTDQAPKAHTPAKIGAMVNSTRSTMPGAKSSLNMSFRPSPSA